MKMTFKKGDLVEQEADLLVVNMFEDNDTLGGASGAVDEAMSGRLQREIDEINFEAKLGKSFHVSAGDDMPFKRVLLIGLGKQEDFSEESLRQAAATIIKATKTLKPSSVVSVLHGAGEGDLEASACGQALAEGVRLAAYRFMRYKSEEETEKNKEKLPDTIEFVSTNAKHIEEAAAGADIGELTAKGTIFTRDLVNVPGQHMRPIELVDAARDIANSSDTINIEVYDEEALEEMGAGGILGVGQASDHPPYLVHLTYKPKKEPVGRVALVGKAITFDSGGLSIKPSKGMATMKLDMAGAGAVLGACSVLGEMQPDVEVHMIFGAAENMVSGNAMRPGDVITAMNGKTIEVLNTDAEGRLTLADALTYANKQDPDVMIDLATLTGACLVALGEEIAGLMGNNDDLISQVKTAAEEAGEKFWELPLEKRYKKQLESPIADYKNIGGRYGGTLTAGLLLQEFVDDTPWVHLDIAGPSFAEKPLNNYTPKGATGFAVRTLLRFLQDYKK